MLCEWRSCAGVSSGVSLLRPDQLDDVAVGVADAGEEDAFGEALGQGHGAAWPIGLTPAFCKLCQRGVRVGHEDRQVAEADCEWM